MTSQEIARNYITIYLSEQGDPGQPAEFYKLFTVTEVVMVTIGDNNQNGTLGIQLKYNIQHITGNTIETVSAANTTTGYNIRFRTNKTATYYNLSTGTTTPTFTNTSFMTNYHTNANKPDYIIVELCRGKDNNKTVLEQKIIPVAYNNQAIFDINQELNQISSTVQGHDASINYLDNTKVGARNYVRGTSDQWSDWIPLRDSSNFTVQFGNAQEGKGNCYLPDDKEIGDEYTSQITVEYSSVEATGTGTFRIAAQASMDNQWQGQSPLWNSQLILHTTEPEDGVYKYVHTYKIDSSNVNTVMMRPMIRIDYAAGALRYKCIKVEKGNKATDWSPAPEDFDDQIVTITDSISQISQTMNSISSTVSSHTTQIDNLNSSVNTNATNISNLTQTASQIQSTVTSINSSINGINSSISSITQRADSIESTVKSLNSGTLNYFHFVGTTWQTAIPYIQEYGLEGVDGSTINRISNLGFNGESGEFIVTCEMRMQTSGASITVDLCDRNAEYGAGSFGLGTTWVKKVFQFKNVNNYNTPGSYNGFIDFTGGFNNTNRLYVRKLCITKGNIAQEFITSSLDIQNHNSDNIANLVFSNISTTSKAYKGYDVYSPTVYNTSGTDTTDYIFQNNMTLKTNTVYTLSFWACSQSNVVIASYLYGNDGCVDGTILPDINSITRPGEMTSGNNSDGVTYSYLGAAYKHYIIHWYNKNAGQRNLLVMRTGHEWWKGSEQPNIKITGIEFREGYWVEDELNTQSMIRQTASEIELKVNNTGINIEDGTITLNANNTTVIGNLNIKDTKQGIIIYDQNNAPRISIQGEELGSLNTSTFGIDKHFQVKKSVNSASATTFDNINLGSYTAGQTLEISLAQINQNGISSGTATTSLSYSYQILRGSTVVKTISGTGDSSSFPTDMNGKPFVWKLNTTTYSVTTAGTYYIKCTFTPNSLSSSIPVEFVASFYVKSSQSNIQKIGLDGAVFAHNQTNYNWFGADQTKLSYGNSYIQLDNNGVLYKPVDTTYAAEIGSITQVKTIYNAITSYNATLYEGFIIVNPNSITSTLTIQLPVANTCAGKKYFIKNMTSQNVQVTEVGHSSTYKSMVKYDSTTTTEYITVNARPSIFISSGLYWLEFYS